MLINANKTDTTLEVDNIEEIHASTLPLLSMATIVINEVVLRRPRISRFWLALERTN